MQFINLLAQTTGLSDEASAGIGLVGVMFYVVFFAIIVVSIWKLFEKAGQPGWAALIPFYNIYILLQIIEKPAWWLVLFFVPLVNIVIGFVIYYLTAQAFGKGPGMGILTALLPIIGLPMLAFGDAQYQGSTASATQPQNPIM